MTRQAAALYLSYDGMLEPLGQSQVLAYLKHLALDRRIHLISFEKKADWQNHAERERMAQDIAQAGIEWHPLRYHKRPSALATLWDTFCGTALGLWLVLRHGLSIVHARSYVPALMALTIKRLSGAKFIFDMRGFWADERVDGGLWPREGGMYQAVKSLEQRFLLGADHVVSLTHAAVREMERFPYLADHMPSMTVIPTCADLSRFVPALAADASAAIGTMSTPLPARADSASIEAKPTFTLGYVGSAGTWYLFNEVLACFKQLKAMKPEAKLLIVNRGEHGYIAQCLDRAGIAPDEVELTSATHGQVPSLMARMDAGIFFIKPVFSKQASAPTKLGEFLGCGIPCIGNAGIGDMAAVLEDERVGVALRSFDPVELVQGLQALLLLLQEPGVQRRCVQAAERHFSLTQGVRKYQEIYASFDAELDLSRRVK
jgi:glycosyltransferase involved in cell wall biosynthesis